MKKFEDILAQCIEDVKAGKSSIEDCLKGHPSVRERLEPLLRIALEIREPPDIKASSGFKVKARVWLMEQIHEREAVTRWPWSRHNHQTKPIPRTRRFSMVRIVVAIALALVALGGGTAYAAQASLPGDALYSLKLGTEQAEMMLPGDDAARAERALSFADRRVEEISALAEKGRSEDLGLAVEKYGYALDMALARTRMAGDEGPAGGNTTALVAEVTARHFSVLDSVYDMVPDEAKEAIAHARNVSMTGHFRALEALAHVNPARGMGINMAAAEGRLNRARETAERGDIEGLENTLQQFEEMAEFGEQISRIAQEVDIEVTRVQELIAEATLLHLEELVDVWQGTPAPAQPAMKRTMANSLARHERAIQALGQRSAEAPASQATPQEIQERERIQERVEQILDDTPPPRLNLPGGVPPGWSCSGCGR